MSLAEIPLGCAAMIQRVDGPRAFRRRLLEMGLVPGVEVRVVTVAPLGDPMQIEIRGGQWSIRRAEAAQITVERVVSTAKPVPAPKKTLPAPVKPRRDGDPVRSAAARIPTRGAARVL